jgi:hypothetical protein
MELLETCHGINPIWGNLKSRNSHALEISGERVNDEKKLANHFSKRLWLFDASWRGKVVTKREGRRWEEKERRVCEKIRTLLEAFSVGKGVLFFPRLSAEKRRVVVNHKQPRLSYSSSFSGVNIGTCISSQRGRTPLE